MTKRKNQLLPIDCKKKPGLLSFSKWTQIKLLFLAPFYFNLDKTYKFASFFFLFSPLFLVATFLLLVGNTKASLES